MLRGNTSDGKKCIKNLIFNFDSKNSLKDVISLTGLKNVIIFYWKYD